MAGRRSGSERTPWGVPEFGATAVLVGTGVLVLGGLASGIAAAVNVPNAPSAVEFGAQWASPALAMILLGVVGLSWWQFQGWSKADFADTQEEEEGAARMERFQKISLWAQTGLLVVICATASFFGAVVAARFDLPGDVGVPVALSQAILAAAVFVTVTVVGGAGLIIGRQVRVQDL